MKLRGRDRELTALRDVLERGRRGAGSVALVEGEGGIGKSRLLGELATEARRLGFDVHVGGAEELERATPLSGVMHVLGRLAGTSATDATVEQLLDLLEASALRHPTFLCIEDLHWADPATLQFVRSAARRVEGLPLALVATLRPPSAQPELAHVVERLAADGARVLRLGPLDDDAIAGLVRDVLGNDPGPALRRRLAGAAGNPLYVLELVGALLEDDDAVVRSGQTVDVTDAALSPSLRVVILRRLASLPPGVFEDLRMCSMLGSSFPIDDLATVTNRSAIELLRSLAPALDAGFLHDASGRLAFRHDLVRSALYEDVPLALRRAIHKEIGAALAAADHPIPVVATHMGIGAEVGDLDAVDWLVRASDALGVDSLDVGVELLERAVALCPLGDPKRAEVLAALVVRLAFTWRGAEAAELGERLLRENLPALTRARLHHGLAHAYLRLGRYDDVIEHWEIVRTSPVVSSERRRSTAADLAWIRFINGEPSAAEALAREAIDDSVDEPGPFARSMGNFVLAYLANASGNIPHALEHGAAAAHWAGVLWEDRSGVPVAPIGAAVALVDADRWDEALEHIHRGQRRSEDSAISNAIQYDHVLCLLRYELGDWDDVHAHAHGTLELTSEHSAGTVIAFATVARTFLHRGDMSSAADAVRRGEQVLAQGGDPLGAGLLLWVRALLEEADGDVLGAVTNLERAWTLGGDFRHSFGAWRLTFPDIVRIARRSERSDLVDEVVAAANSAVRAAGGLGSVASVGERIAALAVDDGPALLAAAEALAGTRRVVEHATALAEAGSVLARAHDARGRDALVRSREMFAELGAVRDVDRIQSVLRDLGMRPGRTGARKRATTGWDALTPSELRVVALVAEGLTNAQIGDRLFVSRRTVQTHIRSVFVKLGASSRAEVAAAFARRS